MSIQEEAKKKCIKNKGKILKALYEADSEEEASLIAAVESGIDPNDDTAVEEMQDIFEEKCREELGIPGMRLDLFYE